MLGGRSVRGRNIADLAIPVDGESFQHIKNRMRAEREAREPAYMPPIVQPGQDPVLGISETRAEQYTHGFNDHTYTWRQAQFGPMTQNFPARVRLAKANSYFVVVTLPSFRPVDQPPMPLPQPPPLTYGAPPPMAGPPLRSPELLGSAREAGMQRATLAAPFPFENPITQTPARPGPYYTWPPPQPTVPPPSQQAYPPYRSVAPLTPRLPAREPPAEATGFTPRSTPLNLAQPMGAATMQLPPLTAGPVTGGVGPSAPNIPGDQPTEEDEGEGRRLRSPRKRRRMGIDDVLQR